MPVARPANSSSCSVPSLALLPAREDIQDEADYKGRDSEEEKGIVGLRQTTASDV